ncbi:FMN-dependent dehydrogenase-domain-containing protein [Pholiota molesta]|nr:FMN-dependent dehydrogenase-domain-containing protein [Pholiota molesta]
MALVDYSWTSASASFFLTVYEPVPSLDATYLANIFIDFMDKVYDVTEFLDEHPGGSKIILKYAGTDATPMNPSIQNNLPIQIHIGAIDPNTVVKVVKEVTGEDKRRQVLMDARPPLGEISNLYDFELSFHQAWAYYSSTSDDEITICENRAAYQRVWFRRRVLRDVTTVDWSTTILGCKSSLPVYISATALGKLGHPDGELNLTRAAGKHGVIQMVISSDNNPAVLVSYSGKEVTNDFR